MNYIVTENCESKALLRLSCEYVYPLLVTFHSIDQFHEDMR